MPIDAGFFYGFDDVRTNSYMRTNASYAIMYAFEPGSEWLRSRQQKLDAYRQQGLADSSREVTTETLNIMGMNWMVQTELGEELLARHLDLLPQSHHRFGRMGQELGKGYYVDVYMQSGGTVPASGFTAADIQTENIGFDLGLYVGSAMEHGVIEQLQNSNLVAASTVKMLEIANTNSQPVYFASVTNWTTGGNVKANLTGYDAGTLAALGNAISNGYVLLLPQSGTNRVAGSGSWFGSAYVELLSNPTNRFMGMIIGGGYNGGYVGLPGAIPNPQAIANINWNSPGAFAINSALIPLNDYIPFKFGADPVTLADGTFHVAESDLTLGGAEPCGLNVTRAYNSSRRNSNLAGMASGWTHNYFFQANEVPAYQPGLGATTPQQMSPMIVATLAMAKLYNNAQPDPKNWTVTALIAKWGIDQLIKNGVSISMGEDTIQFIKQPDGSFTPPANCTWTLTKPNAYLLQQRHGNTFKFNSLGLLTNIVNQYTQQMTFTYNASNWVSTVTDWKGRQLTFNYSGSPSRLSSVSDGTRTVTYGYTANPSGALDLTSVTDAEGKTSTFVYDSNHQIIATKDALGQLVVTNIYDAFGRVMTQYTQGDTSKAWQIFLSGWQTVMQDPAGGKTRTFYDDKSRVTGQQDALGNLSQMVFDGQDHLVMTISPLNETNRSVYDGNHNLLYSIDPLGFSNQFIYDAQNNLVQSIDARGNISRFGYNAHFSLTGSTNGAGDWTTYSFNSDGTLLARIDSGGSNTFTYDGNGQLNSITYPGSIGSESFLNNKFGDITNHANGRGFSTSFQYNMRRQLTNTVAPTNLAANVAYDAVGNVIGATDARGFSTANAWSPTRHLLTTTLPATTQGTPSITNVYDSRDWLSSIIDPLQHKSSLVYDLAGRKLSTVGPLNRTNLFGHDSEGRLLASTNALAEVTRHQYSLRGELTQTIDNAGRTVGSGHDGAGNQVLLTNRNGKIWQFQFDSANRLTNTITPRGAQFSQSYNNRGLLASVTQPSGHTASFSYDGLGRATNRIDNGGSPLNFGFDANGNRTSIVENGKTNSSTYDAYDRPATYKDVDGNLIQYRYDANGNLTNLIYPDGKNVYYAYDSLNRLTNVLDWGGRKTVFTYDLASRVTSITRPNGTYRTINYDAAGEVTNIVEQAASHAPIAFFRFNWDNAARVAWEFAAPLPHSNTPPSRTMTFDDDNRLSTFKGPTMGSASSVTLDVDGNMTYGPLTNDTFVAYSYDSRNRLASAGGINYAYDAAGNRIAVTNGSTTTRFVINPNSALPQVLMRIQNGSTNYYVYGAGLLYQVTESAGTTNVLTYHFDSRGSTIALTDGSGKVTDQMEFSAYATLTYRVGTNDTPFLYNGRYGVMSDSNGLLYMRARYYNPYLCRFANPDPSGFAGGLNLYAYADGNPISMSDPFGLGAVANNGVGQSWFSQNIVGTTGTYAPGIFPGIPGPNSYHWGTGQLGSISAGLQNIGSLAGNGFYQVGLGALRTLGTVNEGIEWAGNKLGLQPEEAQLATMLFAPELGALDSAPTIGQIIGDAHPDSMIHLTTATEAQLANGINEGSSFVRLGDVSHMTLTEYQAQVVGINAAGSSANVSAFVVVNPGTYQFIPAFEKGAAGVSEFLSTWRFLLPNRYVPLPK